MSSDHASNTTHQAHRPAPLIAVIADDFTGAAEIGGIALRYGLKTTVQTSLIAPYDAEVIIIATNTRAESADEARKSIQKLTLQLLGLKPEFIYKKIDSVLRGNVGEELLEQLEVSGKQRALIIPSNPSLNRIIKDGVCYYNGSPLNRSNFSVGKEVKGVSSNVIELMGEPSAKYTTVISRGDKLPAEGLIIGNAVDEEDLDYWAAQLNEQTIMAGGSSFFNALLKSKKRKYTIEENKIPVLRQHKLYICGSAFELSRQVVATASKIGQFVAYMPMHLFSEGADQEELMKAWGDEIVKGLNQSRTAIVAVDVLSCGPNVHLPERISKAMADVVKRVMEHCSVDELFIEGGSTAAAIIEKLNYQKFNPVEELAVGVIRMRVNGNDGVFLTLKPGSYEWPASIWSRD